MAKYLNEDNLNPMTELPEYGKRILMRTSNGTWLFSYREFTDQNGDKYHESGHVKNGKFVGSDKSYSLVGWVYLI